MKESCLEQSREILCTGASFGLGLPIRLAWPGIIVKSPTCQPVPSERLLCEESECEEDLNWQWQGTISFSLPLYCWGQFSAKPHKNCPRLSEWAMKAVVILDEQVSVIPEDMLPEGDSCCWHCLLLVPKLPLLKCHLLQLSSAPRWLGSYVPLLHLPLAIPTLGLINIIVARCQCLYYKVLWIHFCKTAATCRFSIHDVMIKL